MLGKNVLFIQENILFKKRQIIASILGFYLIFLNSILFYNFIGLFQLFLRTDIENPIHMTFLSFRKFPYRFFPFFRLSYPYGSHIP